jgi:hypothetical protein
MEIPGVTGVGVASMAAHCIRKLSKRYASCPSYVVRQAIFLHFWVCA